MMIKLKLLIIAATLVVSNLIAQSAKLVLIGGGQRSDKLVQEILNEIPSTNKNVLIIPMASGDPKDVAEYQKDQFIRNGANSASYILFDSTNVDADSNIYHVQNSNFIFFSGGDQNRLTKILLNTKLLRSIKEASKNGCIISGTSAGAAVMSNIMITGDERVNTSDEAFNTITEGNIITADGFAFLDYCIVDQHFIKRKRNNRLLSLVLENPDLFGVGIDESTAAIFEDNKVKVIGENQIIIYDARDAVISVSEEGKMSGSNLKLHVLKAGDEFNFKVN